MIDNWDEEEIANTENTESVSKNTEADFEILKSDIDIDDWSQLDFTARVQARRRIGLTNESFDDAVAKYNLVLKKLPRYNSALYDRDMESMDFDVPYEEHDITKLEMRYSDYASYLPRLNEMAKNVRYHMNLYEAAYKSLKVMAVKLSSGTVKDKESNAESYVQDFLIGLTMSKALYEAIEDCKKSAEVSSNSLNRILKERENEYFRSSSPYAKSGKYNKFESAMEDEEGFVPSKRKTK